MAQLQPEVAFAPLDRSIRVAQASGMVAAQLNCSMATAILLLEQRANLIGRELGAVANAVIERRIRFGECPE